VSCGLRSLAFALFWGAQLAVSASPHSDFWQRQSIYQIITDRFFDGDPANNNADGNYDPHGHRGTSVHGGDFKGIEQKLDYIQALGATAIWISPVVLNARGEFHGYAARDFYKIDPHWGTLADLRHLVRAAHRRGLLVIDDIVVNHGGNLVDSADPGYPKFKAPPGSYSLRLRDPARPYAPPFQLNRQNPDLSSLFHDNGAIQSYSDSVQVELGELSGLDDFRTESPYVRQRMTEIYKYWIKNVGFDGFRVDTVKHVEMSFWKEWCPAIHSYAARNGKPDFFMFGEVLDNSDVKCGLYTGAKAGGPFALDSVLDYPLYFRTKTAFARGTGNTAQLAERYAMLATNYDPMVQARLVTFLDNHDQPRFLSSENASNHVDRLKLAMAFLYTAQGVPCLYYGTEQAFNGGNDPYDREDMFAGQFEQGPSLGDNFNMTHPLFQWVARLNNLRRLYPALQVGSQTVLCSNSNGPGIFAFSRRLNNQEIVVLLNTATSNQSVSACPTIYKPGTRLINLLDPNDSVTVDAAQAITSITIESTSCRILVDQDQIRPLDPEVVSISPSHDSTIASIRDPITVHFNVSMKPDTVESSFATDPSLKGSFSWTQGNRVMTFRPGNGQWPSAGRVTVRISARAQAAESKNHLCAGFESMFKTDR